MEVKKRFEKDKNKIPQIYFKDLVVFVSRYNLTKNFEGLKIKNVGDVTVKGYECLLRMVWSYGCLESILSKGKYKLGKNVVWWKGKRYCLFE